MTTEEAGRLGGQARASRQTATQRSTLASMAARKRWGNAKPLASTDKQAPSHDAKPLAEQYCIPTKDSAYRCATHGFLMVNCQALGHKLPLDK